MPWSARSAFRWVTKEAVRGRWFRLYAPRSPQVPAGSYRRIAFISLIPNLGDSVMLFPLLDAVRDQNPEAEISVFAAGAGHILSLHPAVDHFYLQAGRHAWWKRTTAARVFDLWNEWRKRYRHLRYDVCVVPRGGVEPFCSPHLAWMLGANILAGYAPELEPERSEFDVAGGDLFSTQVTIPRGVHEVERGAEVLMLAGALRTLVDIRKPVTSLQKIAKSEAALQFVVQHPQLASPYAIVAPGASFPRRRWSPQAFGEIAQTEMIDKGMTPVFVGSAVERPLCEAIVKMLAGPALMFSDTSFVELVALCFGARFFVGNDSGPGHVAGSLGVPTVEVTAFSRSGHSGHHASPQRSHPCGPYVTMVQPLAQIAPCTTECLADSEHCISQVTSTEVRRALRELLARHGSLETGGAQYKAHGQGQSSSSTDS